MDLNLKIQTASKRNNTSNWGTYVYNRNFHYSQTNHMRFHIPHRKQKSVELTFPLVTKRALIGVNLMVRPFRQLLSLGWVNSSLPSIANLINQNRESKIDQQST